jgi:NAD+ synthase
MQIPKQLEMEWENVMLHGVKWTGNYFYVNHLKRAVIGISGGSDSALTAYLTAKAIGYWNVVGMILPESAVTPIEDIEDAESLISSLGIERRYTDISGVLSSYLTEKPEAREARNKMALANLKPRIRMGLLRLQANMIDGGAVVGTDDRSEHFLGYYTKDGDGGVDINPPQYLFKTQVRRLLEHISQKENLDVMRRIAEKIPSPRLWPGQTAEGEIGIGYDVIDLVLYYLQDSPERLKKNKIAAKLGISESVIDDILRRERENRHKDEPRPGPPIELSLYKI